MRSSWNNEKGYFIGWNESQKLRTYYTHPFTKNTEIQTMRMMTTTPETPPPMYAPVLSPFLLSCCPSDPDTVSNVPKQVE